MPNFPTNFATQKRSKRSFANINGVANLHSLFYSIDWSLFPRYCSGRMVNLLYRLDYVKTRVNDWIMLRPISSHGEPSFTMRGGCRLFDINRIKMLVELS